MVNLADGTRSVAAALAVVAWVAAVEVLTPGTTELETLWREPIPSRAVVQSVATAAGPERAS